MSKSTSKAAWLKAWYFIVSNMQPHYFMS
jgi:hypothetical protein